MCRTIILHFAACQHETPPIPQDCAIGIQSERPCERGEPLHEIVPDQPCPRCMLEQMRSNEHAGREGATSTDYPPLTITISATPATGTGTARNPEDSAVPNSERPERSEAESGDARPRVQQEANVDNPERIYSSDDCIDKERQRDAELEKAHLDAAIRTSLRDEEEIAALNKTLAASKADAEAQDEQLLNRIKRLSLRSSDADYARQMAIAWDLSAQAFEDRDDYRRMAEAAEWSRETYDDEMERRARNASLEEHMRTMERRHNERRRAARRFSSATGLGSGEPGPSSRPAHFQASPTHDESPEDLPERPRSGPSRTRDPVPSSAAPVHESQADSRTSQNIRGQIVLYDGTPETHYRRDSGSEEAVSPRRFP